jgi:hypothetical protein
MKNLIKLSLYLFSFTFLLVSCGESSTKGNWTSSDLEKCKSDIISEMQNDIESADILSLSGKTMDEFATCVCDNVSELFDSYSIADADESMTEEEAGMLFLSCFGEESLIDLGIEMEEDITNEEYGEGWSEELAIVFLNGCIGDDPEMEGYCACVLDNIMTDFDASDLDYWGEEDYEALAELYSDCLELISY